MTFEAFFCYNTLGRCRGISLPKGRIFRWYIEEHYVFGEFALLRTRGDMAEVGFVLANEDVTQWEFLREETWRLAEYFRKRIEEEELTGKAIATAGKDLDFFTASIIVDLHNLAEEEIYRLADRVMGILREVNPYRKEENQNG